MAEKITEADLLDKGTVISPAGKAYIPGEPSPAPSGKSESSGMPNEADLIAQGKVVKPSGLAPMPAGGTAPGMLENLANQAVRQTGLTARYAAEGLPQILDLVGAPLAYAMNKGSEALGSNQRFNNVSQSMTNLADMIGLPKPQTAPERVIGEMTKQGFSAMAPVGLANQIAKTTAPVTSTVAKQLAEGPASQVISSALGGGAGQTASEFGFGPGTSIAANLLTTIGANILGQRYGNYKAGNYTPEGEKAMALNAKAKAQGVELSAGDLGNRTATVIENFTQDLPGTGRDAFMQKQAAQTKAMLNRLDASLPETAPGAQMIEGLRGQYNANRTTATKLYDDVNTALINVPGSNVIPVDNFAAKAKAFLAEYPKYLESPDVPESVKKILSSAKAGELQTIPYSAMRDARTLIGGEARAAARQGKPISGELDQLYKNLSTDVRGWAEDLAKTNPDAAKAYSVADKFYSGNVVPYKNNAIFKKVVDPKATQEELAIASDNIMARLFRPNKPNTAEIAMNRAGPGSAEVAQTELVNRALGAGLDERSKAGVSPMRFVNTLNLQDPMVQRVMATPTALSNQIQDVNDIAQATRRSVSAFETPRTGNQNKAVAALVGLVTPATTLQTAGGLLGGAVTDYALHKDLVKGLLFANPGNPYTHAFPALNALTSQTGDVGVYDPVTGKQINRK